MGGIAAPDPHYFWKLDTDPDKSEKLDPDLHFRQNSEALWAQIEPWTFTKVASMLKLEPWRVY
jgi:hypothetical protein